MARRVEIPIDMGASVFEVPITTKELRDILAGSSIVIGHQTVNLKNDECDLYVTIGHIVDGERVEVVEPTYSPRYELIASRILTTSASGLWQKLRKDIALEVQMFLKKRGHMSESNPEMFDVSVEVRDE